MALKIKAYVKKLKPEEKSKQNVSENSEMLKGFKIVA